MAERFHPGFEFALGIASISFGDFPASFLLFTNLPLPIKLAAAVVPAASIFFITHGAIRARKQGIRL